MKILAIDTSSIACSVALLVGDQVISVHEEASLAQAQKILPRIDALIREHHLSLNQLDALAFGCGPGSFTGNRIATSVAQGLGFAMNLPLISVSSLAALAQAAYEDLGWDRLLVAVDARIQEVYWGAYQANAVGIMELHGIEHVSLPHTLSFPDENNWYGVGNAWTIYEQNIHCKPYKIDPTRLSMAKGILALAKMKYQNHEWMRAADACPIYLRNEVAQKS